MTAALVAGSRLRWVCDRRALVFFAAIGVLVFPAVGASSPGQTQKNDEASLFAPSMLSADPCVSYTLDVDVLDFVNHAEPSTMNYGVFAFDTCTNTVLANVTPLATLNVDSSTFAVTPGLKSADLVGTVPGFDSANQVDAPTTFDLHWSTPGNLPSGAAVVTGTISTDGFVVTLDNSVSWNPWGASDTPWAGLWHCRFVDAQPHSSGPGCLGQ
jgi:hypothetical protein